MQFLRKGSNRVAAEIVPSAANQRSYAANRARTDRSSIAATMRSTGSAFLKGTGFSPYGNHEKYFVRRARLQPLRYGFVSAVSRRQSAKNDKTYLGGLRVCVRT